MLFVDFIFERINLLELCVGSLLPNVKDRGWRQGCLNIIYAYADGVSK